MRAVIIGCGNIAAEYARDLRSAGTVDLVGFYDVDGEGRGLSRMSTAARPSALSMRLSNRPNW